ncbi:hypothetical protein L2E82_30279 [Cichorium intybus]|uniref:Uncharacterized protein n=1 Tax=Cichorium intybus TaxID=13427 RepID=A0ACB9CZU6_CICIN|nr:hypothetical protein L2E82_30279 [Cichorium intybus]
MKKRNHHTERDRDFSVRYPHRASVQQIDWFPNLRFPRRWAKGVYWICLCSSVLCEFLIKAKIINGDTNR